MIKLIVGKRGFGKTKILVDMATKAANTSSGNVVCIEKEPKLTYEIPSSVRLMQTDDAGIEGFGEFYGYIAGVLAGNFDITDLFIDSTLKIVGRDYDKLGEFFARLDKTTSEGSVNIVFTVSADRDELPESVQKFIG